MQNLWPTHPCAKIEGLERLSMLPWYAPFLPPERTDKIRESMLASGGRNCWNRAGISASRIKSPSHLRFCPECLRADVLSGRTPYWRRLHQLSGVDICPDHRVWLEDSEVRRANHNYRFRLPTEALLESPARPLASSDACLVGLAKLGEQLLSGNWPVTTPAQLRQNYLGLLRRAGYINCRGQVLMDRLLDDVCTFYPRGLLENLGCRNHYWLAHMVRSRASMVQPIRHLLLVNFLGASLEELFGQKPVALDVLTAVNQPNLACVNFLCPDHGKQTSEFIKAERRNIMGGVVEAYRCDSCGQVQGRCCVGHERTWVRDFGPLWRKRLAELWNDRSMSLRSIAEALRVSCDAVRKAALKMNLPLKRPGQWRSLSTKAYQHLLISKADRRQKKVDSARKRWLAGRERNPDMGMRGLKEKYQSVYMLLWRYDRAWLKAHQPPRRQRRQLVDWASRDRAMVQKLESVARSPGITKTRLARVAGINGWLDDKFTRLPAAQRKWEQLCRLNRN